MRSLNLLLRSTVTALRRHDHLVDLEFSGLCLLLLIMVAGHRLCLL